MRRTLAILALAALTGCGSVLPGGGCITVQTISLKVTDAEGNVTFAQRPDTIAYCPPSVSLGASGAR